MQLRDRHLDPRSLVWLWFCVIACLLEAGLAVHNLRADWGVPHKDSQFHLAGSVEAAAALCLLGAGAMVVRRLLSSRRSLHASIVAVTLTALGTAAVVTGAMIASHASAICACDAN